MSGFFDALKDFKPKEIKKPVVVIGGKKIEVTTEMFHKVMKHGEENFKLVDGEIKRIPPKRFKKTYPVLQPAEEGYHLYENDPYWPERYGKGGFEWQDELE